MNQPRARFHTGGLYGRDLVLTESLTDDTEATGKRSVAERAVLLAWKWRADRSCEGLLRVGQFSLRSGKRCCDCADALTGPVLELVPSGNSFRPR